MADIVRTVKSHLPEEIVTWNSSHSIISFMILCDRHLPQLVSSAREFGVDDSSHGDFLFVKIEWLKEVSCS